MHLSIYILRVIIKLMYHYERDLWKRGIQSIAGLDEAGRGAWAGPLLSAAVILNRRINGLRDSKALKAKDRYKLYDRILRNGIVSIGTVEVEEINEHGLTWANLVAMKRALDGLSTSPKHLLIDYIHLPRNITTITQTSITDGDAISASIAAASIVAKVTRDNLMVRLHQENESLQSFNFHKNFGYGTRAHVEALGKIGPTVYHRQFYKPVARSRQMRLHIENG
ncbi:MAG TPA: ribonuclease HII [bacterium]|jgi:ribonuclease HII|nr:ribonuclease HII [bacterium]